MEPSKFPLGTSLAPALKQKELQHWLLIGSLLRRENFPFGDTLNTLCPTKPKQRYQQPKSLC
jgi:hypothetical protein